MFILCLWRCILQAFRKIIPAKPAYESATIIEKLITLLLAYGGKYRLLFKILVIGSIYQLIAIFGVYTVIIPLDIDLDFMSFVWVFSLVNLIMMVPITISGFGIREGGFIYFLGLFGISTPVALYISLSYFIITLSSSILGGLINLYEAIFSKTRVQ